MAWTWEMTAAVPDGAASGQPGTDDGHGAPASGFASQSDAESWLGGVWRELAEQGVTSVSLFEEERLVYGPMSLEPA